MEDSLLENQDKHNLGGIAGSASLSPGDLVLIIGATGGCGSAAYHHCKAENFRVRALVRDEAKGRRVLGGDADLVLGSLDNPASLEGAFAGVDAVIVALGAVRSDITSSSEKVDYQGTLDLITAARSNPNLKKYIWVTSGQVTHPERFVAKILNSVANNVLGHKFRGEMALRASGLPYVIVRPMGLANNDDDTTAPTIAQGDPWGSGRITRNTVGLVCTRALLLAPTGVSFECKAGNDKAAHRGEVDWSTEMMALRLDTSPDLQRIIDACSFDKHVNAAYWFRFKFKAASASLLLGITAVVTLKVLKFF